MPIIRILKLLFLASLIFALVACSGATVESTNNATASQVAAGSAQESSFVDDTQLESATPSSPISVEYDRDDLETSLSGSDITYIMLEGDSISYGGSGVTVEGSLATITSAGAYNISGILNDGQIIVDTQDVETVVLILNQADITCSSSAPIYASNAEKVVITLAENTENYVTDGASYIFEDAESDEPNAAIFSKDDLTINGSGSLTVNANYNNGIASKDDLKITGGSITVNAVNDGIKGKDSIAVRDGVITVNASADGFQSNNDEDAEKGYIYIEGGTIHITAGLDGIQAETRLMVSGGDITISSGGGSLNSSSGDNWGDWGSQNMLDANVSTNSAKGLKAGIDITISSSTINIDSSDDSIHSNDSLTINNGDIHLSSGDDGIHSDTILEINGGDIIITKSYEGIESASLTINNGNIHIVASDDGINAAGGNDGSSINGRPGQNNFNMFESGDNNLYVNGGYIEVDAMGDGLDINGIIEMTGGTVIANGPTANNNGALDYLGTFNISGGFLVAVGSSGMAQAPSTSSTQYSVMYNFPSQQAAGTMVHIETEDGEEILTFVPTKAYQSVVLSSPELTNGSTYIIFSGGNSTGTVADGLYSNGAYTAGTQVASLTISSMVTSAGLQGGGFPAGPDGNRPPRP